MYYFDATIPYLYKAGIRRYFFEVLNTFNELNSLQNQPEIPTIVTPSKFQELNELSNTFKFNLLELGYPIKLPLLHRIIYYNNYFSRSISLRRSDILFSPYFQLPGKYVGPNVISTIHDMLYFDMQHLYKSIAEKVYVSYYNHKLKESIINRHRIVTVSEYSRDRIQNYFNDSSRQIYIYYNTLSGPYYSALIKEHATKIDAEISFDSPYILYSAGWEARKNISILFRAIQKYLSSEQQEKLHFVFTGITSEALFRELKKFGIQIQQIENLHAVGHISSLNLASLYHNAQAVLNLSNYEGFGFPILESLLAGKKIICSDIPPFKEIAHENAIYVNQTRVDDIVDALCFIHKLNLNFGYFDESISSKTVELNNNFRKQNLMTIKNLLID